MSYTTITTALHKQQGHSLQFYYPHGARNFICYQCRKEKSNQPIFHCSVDRTNFCMECIWNSTTEPALQRVDCTEKHGHTLYKVVPPYPDGWKCSHCNYKFTGVAWFCINYTCGFCLCMGCANPQEKTDVCAGLCQLTSFAN